VAEKDG